MNSDFFSEQTELTERRRRVLHIVIEEYVHTTQPVSSSSIVHNYDLGVGTATIRNDLAALEADGLLMHPHISAGRIPTDAGYRYFVRHILAETELPLVERRQIRAQFEEVRQDIDQWLRVTTSVLSSASQSAALATAPRAARSRYKHMELVAIQGPKVLLVLVLQDGAVKQQLLHLDEQMEQSELGRVSNELNDRLTGQDVAGFDSVMAILSPFAKQVAMLVRETLQRLDNQSNSQVYRDGLSKVLQAPEFAGGENVRRVVQVMEEYSLLDQIAGELNNANDVRVVISGNGHMPQLRDISMVISRYGLNDHATGLLGVVGPLRMEYGRNISTVRFVAGLMSELVEDFYGA